MHEHLFEAVDEWSGKQDPAEQFMEYAAEQNLDTDAFVACLKSGETADQVQAEFEGGAAMGVRGAPAFFVNDWFLSGAQPFQAFQQAIDAALRGEHPPPTPTPLPPGVTPFDPDPEQPGYTYGGDAVRGSEGAKISLIEFIDFQSPENRKHFLDVWPELERNYVGPGKMRLIIKHFPVQDRPQGLKAAEAAECAGQQGAFWAMHDLLFQRQEEWSQGEDAPATLNMLKQYAVEAGLDAETFAVCMDEGQTESKVKRDLAIAQQNRFPPAPQAFIFDGQRANYVPLDQLLDQLQQAIDQLPAQ
jgi:protein-disulfide isomerase